VADDGRSRGDAPLILTLDLGSSSVRAMLFDAQGRAVPGVIAREEYALQAQHDGTSEVDADRLLSCAYSVLDRLLALAGGRAGQIGAVAVDTFATSFLALDSSDRPLGPLITYADTRNEQDARALRDALDERAVHQRTGCLLRTSYWPARLAWLRRAQPDVWGSAARYVTLGEYLELQLFGAGRAGISPASWTGLLNRESLGWDGALLDHLGVEPQMLAAIADTRDALYGLREPYAARWPALRHLPWYAAVGDGAAANIGSGCTRPGRVALTVGTTGALRIVTPEVVAVPEGLWCYRVDRRRALLGGATSEGGNVYAWLRQTLRLGDAVEVEQALATMRPTQHALQVLPFWAGERSPGWAGDAQASLIGMTMATTPIEIVRASLEGVAYRFAQIADRLLAGVDPASSQIVVSGGGLTQSPAWTQIVADVLGRSLVISQEPEATSRGVALLALEALGALEDLDQGQAVDGPVVTPRPEHYAAYQQAAARQRELYQLLVG
jgi:gluconokinase